MAMPEHIKEFKEALESGRDMDYIANNGYTFSKDELISICKELFYTAYQEITDGGCAPVKEAENDYKSFIRRFMDNMNEHETEYFKEEAYE